MEEEVTPKDLAEATIRREMIERQLLHTNDALNLANVQLYLLERIKQLIDNPDVTHEEIDRAERLSAVTHILREEKR
jgi:hypothetical protein